MVLASCTPQIRYSSSAKTNSPDISNHPEQTDEPQYEVYSGKASYYADKFHGRRTASGEIYDKSKMTAAHRSLPFGTIVEVTNLSNNRSVTVRINDRGPFVSGRIIDLSRTAAEEIGMIRQGVVDVEIRIISTP